MIFVIISPICKPACCAGYPSESDVISGVITAVVETIQITNSIANTKFIKGPANTTAILAQTLFSEKLLSAISPVVSSPIIRQKPPIGNALKEYNVSPICFDAIVGPIPTANSSTNMPPFFATIKCPNSCIITITLNTIIDIIIDIIFFAAYLPIYCFLL